MPSRNFSLRLSLFNAVLFLGTGIQLPFLPLWLKDKGLPDSQVALVVALMMAVRILAIPLGTYIADLTRRRRAVIIACATGAFLAYALLHAMTGFWPILITGLIAAALLAPIVPLTETLAVEGSAHYGLDYGRIRLWASLSSASQGSASWARAAIQMKASSQRTAIPSGRRGRTPWGRAPC